MARRLRAAPLVGRAAELELVEDAAARAAHGSGALVVVRGEPGVGKSRLLAELVASSDRAGRPALVGRAVEGCGPFRPIADALLARQRTAGLPPPAALEPFATAPVTEDGAGPATTVTPDGILQLGLGFWGSDGRAYCNTAATGLFLDRAKPSYLGGILEMANARLYPFWGSLGEALRTGLPQNESKHGEDPSRRSTLTPRDSGSSCGP